MIKNPKSSAVSKFHPIALSHNKIIEFKSKKVFNCSEGMHRTIKKCKQFYRCQCLLTAALSNITIYDQLNAKNIGWCQYKLEVVYYKTGQLELAIKYYNSAIDRLPEEEEIIYNLWTIYGYHSDSKNIENLLNKMPEGSLKALLKLGRDLNNITNEKLETMNSKNLLPYHVQSFELYKYTAKYNALSDERKIAHKIRLAKDLKTII
ncbi:MAG: hypothetical protein AB8U82_07455 [Rickettsia endosymbiont of Haemaphysalis japonica]